MFMSLIRSLNYRITSENVKHLIAAAATAAAASVCHGAKYATLKFYWALVRQLSVCHFSIYTHHSNFGHPVEKFFKYSLMRAQNLRWFRCRHKVSARTSMCVCVCVCEEIESCVDCDWNTMGVNYKTLEAEMEVINLHRSWNNCCTSTYQADDWDWVWTFDFAIQNFSKVVWDNFGFDVTPSRTLFESVSLNFFAQQIYKLFGRLQMLSRSDFDFN